MNVGMQGSEPAGFGAPAVKNAARPATTQASQSERRVSKEQSFDDHLDQSLSSQPEQEEDPAAPDAVVVPVAVQPELREGGQAAEQPTIAATEKLPTFLFSSSAQPSGAVSGEGAQDVPTRDVEPTVPGTVAQEASARVTAFAPDVRTVEASPGEIEPAIEQPVASQPRQDSTPAQNANTQSAGTSIDGLPNPTEMNGDLPTREKSNSAAQAIHAEERPTQPAPVHLKRRQFDSSGEQKKEGQNPSNAAIPAEMSAGRPKPVAPEPHAPAAPEPTSSLPEVVRTVASTAQVQFQAIVGSDVDVAPPAEAPRGPLLPETTDSIIQSLRMVYQRGGGDAVVHIKPEHLGPVSVSLRVENGVVSAVVNADNPAVAEWLKANEHVLREGLASSGLYLERFAVRRDGQPSDDSRRGWRQPEQRERRRRSMQPDSTFEVSV